MSKQNHNSIKSAQMEEYPEPMPDPKWEALAKELALEAAEDWFTEARSWSSNARVGGLPDLDKAIDVAREKLAGKIAPRFMDLLERVAGEASLEAKDEALMWHNSTDRLTNELADAQKEIERLLKQLDVYIAAHGEEVTKRQKAEAAAEQAHAFSGEGECPLCKYEMGFCMKACWFHEEINKFRGQRDHYKTSSEQAREEGRREQREKDLKIAGMGWQNPGEIYKAIRESKP